MAKLKPRARLIRTIGDRLISGPEAAVIELVKNSYDADSPSVEIEIIPPNSRGDEYGRIVITDKGHGMTFSNIIDDWLEPATDSKTKKKTSRSNKRVLLGAKGVGRFASASLGRKLLLISRAQVEGGIEVSTLRLDWDVFEQHKYLDEVDIDISREFCAGEIKTGVRIEIFNLYTTWDEHKVRKLIRELRRLANPQIGSDSFNIFLNLDAFHKGLDKPYAYDGSEVLRRENRQLLDPHFDERQHNKNLILPYSLNNQCDYSVVGEFKEDGTFVGEYCVVRGDNTPIKITVPAQLSEYETPSCGSLVVDLKIYDLEKDSVKSLFERMGLKFEDFGLQRARKIINDGTGVAIYRSGFRVRPYGEPENDWLQLEKRRVQEPSKRIGHNQISGSIHIGDEESSGLIERSSREGLETNGSYYQLIKQVSDLLVVIERRRLDFREKAGISRKPKKGIDNARSLAGLDSIVKAIRELSEADQANILMKVEQESAALTKALDEIEEYQKLLESRAALGMVVGQLLHDGRTYLESMSSYSNSIVKNAEFLMEKSAKGDVVRKQYPGYGQGIRDAVKGMSALFKSLDPRSGRRRGKAKVFSLLEVLLNSYNLLEEVFIENGVEFIRPEEDAALYGYEGDLQAALMNVFSNALHWLSVTPISERLISVRYDIDESFVYLYVSNNGMPIDESSVDKIFDAGYSLKSEGHGLGLSIAREACRNSKGELLLLEIVPETTFLIKFPKGE